MPNINPFEHPLKYWYANIDTALDACASALAMVVCVVHGPRVESFGSGFFYLKSGWPYFITAKHVVDDALSNTECGRGAFLVTRGRRGVIDLSKMEFLCASEWDVAVAPL
jgi:hypothetical protein